MAYHKKNRQKCGYLSDYSYLCPSVNKSMMKTMTRLALMVVASLLSTAICAGEKLELKDLTSGDFTAASVGSVRPLSDGERYARMGEGGRCIEVCSFKTGKQVGTLLDVNDVKGGEIERIERRRQRRAEQQRGAEHDADAGDEICHLTPGFPLRSDCRPDHRSGGPSVPSCAS